MVKYIPEDTSLTMSEVPDEISLCVNITNCPNRCLGCHSPYLRNDIGEVLTTDVIDELISKNDGISCFCFMGEGNDKQGIVDLATHIRDAYPDLKIAIYSGKDGMEPEYVIFDYVKIGSYKAEFGPLNKKTTNQRMLQYNHNKNDFISPSWYMNDITYKFWK